ncbi:FGGY family carbohydrate kinase [Flavihumibacter sp. CACIAM 22H1]|uniref:xylulokinase n=1 Tax=Flavihumibacter sp. CACIAM 22H1 TaxID=1812911 RepID=UPI0007A85076|nr:FGGY family carbohydrate kinase [Flavihumibacter sp. CACIAM 22H1]KYP12998.1 MAG: carbohydrate kinase [Flavihumibacter sp. CACIAM 22H1]
MYLLGIDLGTSSVKVTVVEAANQTILATASYPETEADIIAIQPGWAEQSPELWWDHVEQAILKCHATKKYNPAEITAIGIAYQMHGLVLVDKDQKVLRNAIIWCDSRAVQIGEQAFQQIGPTRSLQHLLNSPGNFTASKLAWVKANEPRLYEKIDKVLLPGDFIALKMTGEATTTVSALSEGVFWDFKENRLSEDVLKTFGFSASLFPDVRPLFSSHGQLNASVAARLALKPGIVVAYKAGDQPNNALSLNVLEPGEVAATAGTSGVIYGVSDLLGYDTESRINSFAHVNYMDDLRRIGVLLCINGTGIFNRWIKTIAGQALSYSALNELAAQVSVGANGLRALPFGNGAERMLNNQIVGGQFHNLDFNVHGTAHLVRAVQEGISCSFRYGLDIMRENGIQPAVVRAGKANLFLSDVFTQAFATLNQVSVEFYEGDGSFGAAIGAGIGTRYYRDAKEAGSVRTPVSTTEPGKPDQYETIYQEWKKLLAEQLASLH